MTWYEDEVRLLEQRIQSLPPADDRVVFYGSSSIRLWTTLANDFPDVNTLNLGFGGSTLASCTWFFERLIVPANPHRWCFTRAIMTSATVGIPKKSACFSASSWKNCGNTFPMYP